ncbi:MAG: 4-amino-4-deoxy-L-arabinose transferase [Nocardioidaceae bacterium]
MNAAAAILEWTLARPPTLGAGRLVCVDGPAGSGKTTLGDALAALAAAPLVHMDDVYEGWSGLAGALPVVASSIVAPLCRGLPGRYRRYDWHRGELAEEHVVEPSDLLVIEGVGSGSLAIADAVTCLVWMSTPSDLRLSRGIARDGEEMRDHWLRWRADEDEVLARERTLERADVIVDGTSSEVRFSAR